MKKIVTLILPWIFFLNYSQSQAQTQIIVYTNFGGFVLQMYDTLSPITAGNFIKLTKENFYDGVIFHRVISGFVIQGGDPTGSGSGGPGYTIQDEFIQGLSNVKGTISMANTGAPNSGGSQFFINLVDNTRLDFDKAPLTSKHPVFGYVLHNINVVEDIGAVPVDGNDRPLTAVVMDSLRILFSPTTDLELPKDVIKTIRVFPNPITSESVISFKLPRAQVLIFSMYDALGRTVNSWSESLSGGLHSVPLSDFQEAGSCSGVYFLEISDGNRVFRKKLVYPK